MSFDITTGIASTIAQCGSEIYKAEAIQVVKESLKGAVKINVYLNKDAENYIKTTSTEMNFFFSKTDNGGSHPVMAACRVAIRECYSRMVNFQHNRLLTLVVGASFREISMYKNYPNVRYYVANCDNKDLSRYLLPMYNSLQDMLVRKSRSDNTDFKRRVEVGYSTFQENKINQTVTLDDLKVVNDLWSGLHGVKDVVVTNLVSADLLLLEDVGYEFHPKDWVDLFRKTGAKKAIGYMILPYQLLPQFRDMPDDPYFRMRFFKRDCVEHVDFLYGQGSSNGYEHRTSSWSVLLTSPVITFDGLSLEVELCERVGPMQLFTVIPCSKRAFIPRTIALPEGLQYVRILNVAASYNKYMGYFELNPNADYKVYFSMRASEFYAAFNYILSVDPASRSLENVTTFIRKMRGGLSLAQKEFAPCWWLPAEDVHDLALAMWLYIKFTASDDDDLLNAAKLQDVSMGVRFKNWIKKAVWSMSWFRSVYEWLYVNKLRENLVTFPDGFQFQRDVTKSSTYDLSFRAHDAHAPEGDELEFCVVCDILKNAAKLPGSGIEQEIKCINPTRSTFTIKRSQGDIEQFRTKLKIQRDGDGKEEVPAALRAAIDIALENIPKTDFEYTVEVRLIVGPAGSGKSTIIRGLSDPIREMVLLPFRKLTSDYKDKDKHYYDADGKFLKTEKTTWRIKTLHHAFAESVAPVVHLDEFTAADMELILMGLPKWGTKVLWVYGDPAQTKIRDMIEGRYFGDIFPLENVNQHMLCVNYRNPPAIVAVMNMLYYVDTPMRSARAELGETEHGIVLHNMKTHGIPQYTNAYHFAFTHHDADLFCSSKDSTVRSSQGTTVGTAVLYVTKESFSTTSITGMSLVGTSRHTVKLVIAHDDSPEALGWISSHKFDDEVFLKEGYKQYLGVKAPVRETPLVADHPAITCLKSLTAGGDISSKKVYSFDTDVAIFSRQLSSASNAQVLLDVKRVPKTVLGMDLMAVAEKVYGTYGSDYVQGMFIIYAKLKKLRINGELLSEDTIVHIVGRLSQILSFRFASELDYHVKKHFPIAANESSLEIIKGHMISWIVSGFPGVDDPIMLYSMCLDASAISTVVKTFRTGIKDNVLDIENYMYWMMGYRDLQTNYDMNPNDEDRNSMEVMIGLPYEFEYAESPTKTKKLVLGPYRFVVSYEVNDADYSWGFDGKLNVKYLIDEGHSKQYQFVSSLVDVPSVHIDANVLLDKNFDIILRNTNVKGRIINDKVPSSDHSVWNDYVVKLEAEFVGDSNNYLSHSVRRRAYDPLIENAHIGQLKLLVGELNMLSKFKDRTDIAVVYVGGACGIHLPYLHKAYKIPIIVIDPADLHSSVKHKMIDLVNLPNSLSNVIYHAKMAVHIDKLAILNNLASLKKKLILISDFRTADGYINEYNVWADNIVNGAMASITVDGQCLFYYNFLKFRPHYRHLMATQKPTEWSESVLKKVAYSDPYEYSLDLFRVYEQVYAKSGSAERRVVVRPGSVYVKWTDVMFMAYEETVAAWNYDRNTMVLSRYGYSSRETTIARIILDNHKIDGTLLKMPTFDRVPDGVIKGIMSGMVYNIKSTNCFAAALSVDITKVFDYLKPNIQMFGSVFPKKLLDEFKSGQFSWPFIQAYVTTHAVRLKIFVIMERCVKVINFGNVNSDVKRVFYANGHYYPIDVSDELMTAVLDAYPEVSDVEESWFINENYLLGGRNLVINSDLVSPIDQINRLIKEKHGVVPVVPIRARLLLEEFMLYGGETIKYEEEAFVLNTDSYIHASKDAYLMSEFLMSSVATAVDDFALNSESSVVIPDGFRSLELKLCETIMPINQRGHFVKQENEFRAAGLGEGLHFSSINQLQEIGTMRARYDTIRQPKSLTYDSKLIIDQMTSKYFREMKVMRMSLSDYYELYGDEITAKFMKDAVARNYFKRFEGTDGDDDMKNVTLIRFHLKKIFKPFVSTKEVNIYKAGQGISAWSPALLLAFCCAFRIIAAYDRDTDRKDDDVYLATDNGIDFNRFVDDVARQMREQSKFPTKSVIGDAVMYDANQDQGTQYMEYSYMRCLGISEKFLDLYFSYRHHLKVKGSNFTVFLTFEKTSGEPATLFANGIPMKLMLHWCTIGGGKQIMIYKGDDVYKNQGNLEVVPERLNEIYSVTNLRIKILEVDRGEFCGMVMSDGVLLPNIHRWLVKIVAYRAKSYSDFAEYQISIRDQLALWRHLGEQNVIMACADLKQCSYTEAENVYFAVQSWAHINEQQWLSITTNMKERVFLPQMTNLGLSLVM